MIVSVLCWMYLITTLSYGTSPTCDEVVQKVAETDMLTDIQFPPPMPGTWVSDRCEVRPGPEYLLRWHWYSENGTYTHNTFVYGDEGCSKALWSRCIKGKYGLRGRSWLTQGASQVDFNLDEVMFVVYSTAIAQDLSSKANTSCPGVVVGRWLPEVEYIVYRHQERNETKEKTKDELEKERACMSLLRLSYEDVGLVRIQKRPPMPFDAWGPREEILLGESRGKTTVFHDPMIRANQTTNCIPCQQVQESTLLYPPTLDLQPALPLHLSGEWVSMRCEIRQNGLFLRRRFRVSGRSWHAEFLFYSEPKCQTPTLLAAAEGVYALAKDVVSKVHGAVDFDFAVDRTVLTLFEKGLAESLQDDGSCGPSGVWQVGVARDLTPSGGCAALGIKLPTTEYELVRIESDNAGNTLLFLGQFSDERKTGVKERPTHFQPPLLQCASPEFPLTHFLNSYNESPKISGDFIFMILILRIL